MSLPWINDPTPADYLDAATDEWADALTAVQAAYPDAHIAEIVPGAPHFYRIEAEHEDYLIEFADADYGHLTRGEASVWEVAVFDADSTEVWIETREALPDLVEAARAWCLGRVDTDRVAQADDPDRAHDSREA